MKVSEYVRDKIAAIFMGLVFVSILEVLLVAFRLPITICAMVALFFGMFGGGVLLWDLVRKKRFYDTLMQNLEQLDKKYLVLETVNQPDFLEGLLLHRILYETDKSMAEHVKDYEQKSKSFQEYIEMWIHEVKLPIASLRLMTHNEEIPLPKKYMEQVGLLDRLVDQILYYVRAEHAQQDYLIKETWLQDTVKKAAIHNKDDLLGQNITFTVEQVEYRVITDAKWLEFILNQIINNAIKYKDAGKECLIRIWGEERENHIALHIWDNGIGIVESDLPRIFEKSFTGENGRKTDASTGMGLYIVRSLCDRLGHSISAFSQPGEYTEFVILIGKNEYYTGAGV